MFAISTDIFSSEILLLNGIRQLLHKEHIVLLFLLIMREKITPYLLLYEKSIIPLFKNLKQLLHKKPYVLSLKHLLYIFNIIYRVINY